MHAHVPSTMSDVIVDEEETLLLAVTVKLMKPVVFTAAPKIAPVETFSCRPAGSASGGSMLNCAAGYPA